MRAVLLSHPTVAEYLKTEVIACWQEVRPVPKVKIDFGNGKILERTLTGNTVLYLCRPNGDVVDAWPGVYLPMDFMPEFSQAISAAKQPTWDAATAKGYHDAKFDRLMKPEFTTMSKSGVESPVLSALGRRLTSAVALQANNASIAPEPPTLNPSSRERLSSPKVSQLTDPQRKQLLAEYAKMLIDISSLPRPTPGIQQGTGAEKKLSAEQRAQLLLAADSRANRTNVRPGMHLLLGCQAKTVQPSELQDAIYRQFLHVAIDDPYLGLADVLLPGTPGGN